MERLSNGTNLGQLLIVGFDGTEMSPQLASLLSKIQPAGVILFARNIIGAEQTHRLLRECQKCVATPLLTSVDLEGGQVDRFRNVLGPAPSAAEVFASRDRKLFRRHGRVIGENCRALGFNVDFAPLLDLAFEASRKVMSSRAVSADPKEVIGYAREFLRGLGDAGVLGCGKHFPGLGEGKLDSHHELPLIEKSLKKMWAEDLVPYRILRRQLPFVMISHAAYPDVTGDRAPASLSKKWITEILRKRIGYDGLVVSDDMEMGAVLKFAPIEETVVQHIRAGGDLALICHSEELITRGYEALVRAAERDGRFRARVAEAARRVEKLKRKLFASPRRNASGLTPGKIERLSRWLWEFSEEVRMAGIDGDVMSEPEPQRMIVAGVMSGTSADGINVALVRFAESTSPETSSRRRPSLGRWRPRYTIIAHDEYPFPARVRVAILGAMNAESASVADLARLNFLLGELYADAVARTVANTAAKTGRTHRVKLDLVGCHGQTLYHQGEPASFLGRKLAVTWQTGEGAVVASRLGVPVVSDFRPADMAVGGKGAPLVPFLDYFLYRDGRVGRIAQNIGGIANLTAIPAGASPREIVAFDTGPGNMVIDAVMQELFGRRYDRGGKVAAAGQVDEHVVVRLMGAPFFRRQPPRAAGREEFGREYVARFLEHCRGLSKADVVATATALTARSIADALQRFVLPRQKSYRELVVSGGGTKNPTLMSMLRGELQPLGIELRFSDEFGVPSEAKEAVAFAALAYETWHRRPSNVPSATGARRAAILGKISYV